VSSLDRLDNELPHTCRGRVADPEESSSNIETVCFLTDTLSNSIGA
jgi:hypothetical protein